jgi:glyoxylase-like metal-dependent hydrolase (beta-lactamase superfamily II)
MNIHTLDLNFQKRPNTIAAYLVEAPQGPVLVETGPDSTLDTLKLRLAELAYLPEDIHHVFVTHIHLDHAGAAGWWAQQGARVYVHRVGAPHLINPSKLLFSAARIYGDQMDKLWGKMVPAPAEQVISVSDGDSLEVNGLVFKALDTPGHAYHHLVYQLEGIAFTGDAAGIHIPGPAFVDLPAPPPEFNYELWLDTIDIIQNLPLQAIYPTHFDRVDEWQKHLNEFRVLLTGAVEFVRSCLEASIEREEIVRRYTRWHLERADSAVLTEILIDRYETTNPLYMSVDGIIRYWQKKQKTN